MRTTAIVVVAALLLAPTVAQADVSPWMSYQGVLRDASGSPVPDGGYSVQFNIFDAELAGASLWTETQTVTTSGGIFNVHLGSVTPLDTLAWDVPYWLGMRIEGEPWLVPRTPFTTVPYAARAVTAETVLEGDTDWAIDGDDVYHETGYVGIGLATGAGAPLDVLAGSTRAGRFQNDAQGANFAVSARNDYGTAAGFFGGAGTDTYPGPHAAIYAVGEADHRALHAVSDERYAIYAHSNTNMALKASTTSGAICAQFDGGQVIVNDRLRVDEFYMNPGTTGHVLTSDSYGLGTWQAPAAIPDSDWTVLGPHIYRDTGNVGIGTTAIDARLDVVANPGGVAADFVNEAVGTNFTTRTVNNTGTAGSFFSGTTPASMPTTHSAVYGVGGTGFRGASFLSDDEEGVYAFSNTSDALVAVTHTGQSAYFGGGRVWVDDRLKTNEFEMAPGTAGYVLTSDASGVGTWQAPAAGADSDWTISGDDVHHDVGNVGIGTAPGSHTRLEVLAGDGIAADFSNNAGPALFTVRAENGGGTAAGFFANGAAGPYPASPVAVFGYGRPGAGGGYFHCEDGVGLKAVTESGISALDASNGGSGFSGRFTGGVGISVEGEVQTDGFRMTTGASSGYVLTSDVDGVGTWQAAASGSDGDWNIVGSDMQSAVSGRVGIGPLSPLGKLGVSSDLSESALYVSSSGVSVPRMVDVSRSSVPSPGNDILELSVPAGSPAGFQFIEADVGGVEKFRVFGDGYVYSAGGGDFYTSDLDTNFPALRGVTFASGSEDVVGVYGESTPGAGFGIGGEFIGGRWGVKASVIPEGTGEHYALYGAIDGGPGTNYGVAGLAQNGVSNYGVWGGATVGSGYAGYFAGDSHTSGTLTAATKSFKIDHPLDPENKYLMHSSVESDEMMNVYNGNVLLDERGEAWVEMPEWFEVLNRDFRYQLTPLGAPGPNLHIAERIVDGRFKIAGGDAGMDVSWMVTGVRHDPVALANRLSVEVDKPAHEAGKYLNPEAYGKPASMGVGRIEAQGAPVRKNIPRPASPEDGGDGD